MTEQLGSIDQRDFRNALRQLDEAILHLHKVCESLDEKPVSLTEAEHFHEILNITASQLGSVSSLLETILYRHPPHNRPLPINLNSAIISLKESRKELQNLKDIRGVKYISMEGRQWMEPNIQRKIKIDLNEIYHRCRQIRAEIHHGYI